MTAVLDDIRFLADSKHRVVAMDELADGPRSRSDLRSLTGASSATVGRLLQEFERRGWLTQDGSQYALTPLGQFVSTEFAALHTKMTVARDLRELLPNLPLESMGVEIEWLADATVTRATKANPLAMASRIREFEHHSEQSLSLTDFFPEPCIDGRHEAVVEGTQSFEAVFEPGVIEAAMVSDFADKFAQLIDADGATVYVYDGAVSCPVLLNDGLACLVVRDAENTSVGLIETDDERVVSWVEEVYEAHRQDATLLTADDLSAVREGTLTSRASRPVEEST